MNRNVNNFVKNVVLFIFVCAESENANNISLCCNTDTGTEQALLDSRHKAILRHTALTGKAVYSLFEKKANNL